MRTARSSAQSETRSGWLNRTGGSPAMSYQEKLMSDKPSGYARARAEVIDEDFVVLADAVRGAGLRVIVGADRDQVHALLERRLRGVERVGLAEAQRARHQAGGQRPRQGVAAPRQIVPVVTWAFTMIWIVCRPAPWSAAPTSTLCGRAVRFLRRVSHRPGGWAGRRRRARRASCFAEASAPEAPPTQRLPSLGCVHSTRITR
jgi:hypothetical protein